MKRTSVMADEHVLAALRALARDRGVSLGAVVREALEEKAASLRLRPRGLGAFTGGDPSLSERASDGRVPPR